MGIGFDMKEKSSRQQLLPAQRSPLTGVLFLLNQSVRLPSAPLHHRAVGERAGRKSRKLSPAGSTLGGAAQRLPPSTHRSLPSVGHQQPHSPSAAGGQGPVGLETSGGAAALPCSRPMEVPLCSENTATIFGSPDSHFTCQQIYISQTDPLFPSQASSVLGSWEGNGAYSLPRSASSQLMAWLQLLQRCPG